MHRWFVFLLFCGSLHAQLAWDRQEVNFKATLKDHQMVAEFPFRNAGKQAVTIVSAKPDCASCTFVDLKKRVYSPGEKGVLKATYVFGDRYGLQKKTIVVQTDVPKEEPTVLTISVTIPQIIDISPGVLFWEQGRDKAQKVMNVKVMQQTPVKVLAVTSTSDLFQPELKVIKEGRTYEVRVTPKDVSQAAQALISIQTDFPKDAPRTINTYVVIRPSLAAEQPIQIQPGFVFWHRDEEKKPKTIKVSVTGDKPFKVSGVESSERSIRSALKTVQKGREYEILVTPADTSKPVKAILHIATDPPTSAPLSAYAIVN